MQAENKLVVDQHPHHFPQSCVEWSVGVIWVEQPFDTIFQDPHKAQLGLCACLPAFKDELLRCPFGNGRAAQLEKLTRRPSINYYTGTINDTAA